MISYWARLLTGKETKLSYLSYKILYNLFIDENLDFTVYFLCRYRSTVQFLSVICGLWFEIYIVYIYLCLHIYPIKFCITFLLMKIWIFREHIFDDTGYSYIWSQQFFQNSDLLLALIRNRLHEQFTQEWHSLIQNSHFSSFIFSEVHIICLNFNIFGLWVRYLLISWVRFSVKKWHSII
jgi:hypothetical protein